MRGVYKQRRLGRGGQLEGSVAPSACGSSRSCAARLMTPPTLPLHPHAPVPPNEKRLCLHARRAAHAAAV